MMMMNRRLFLGGTASAAALALLASCAKNNESATTDAISSKDPSALKQGGELKMSLTSTIANWNYLNVDGNTVGCRHVMWFVFPYFIDWADDGTPSPNPDFLTKYEAEEVGGKTVATVALNEKAVWGNGRSMDSEDIKESLIHGTDSAYKWASTDGLDQVESVEIVDNLTAKVTFKAAFPDWTNVLSGFSPKELMKDADTFNNAMAGEANFNNDFFAGPFKIDSYDNSQQLVTLVPNDKWWGKTPKLDKVTFRVLDSAAEATAFANKSLDVIDYIISADVYTQCIGRSDAEVRQNYGLQWRHFTINCSTGVLADKSVRQAIVRACNREAIASSALAGLPVDASKLLLGNRFFMPNQEGYQDNSGDWTYNVDAAKKLLDDAGWAPGSDGIRVKDGQRLSFGFTLPSGTPTTENEANLLQAQLKEVGIEVKLVPVDTNGYFKDYINTGNYEMTSFTWQGTQYPMANIGQIYGTGALQNYSRISVPEIDEYIQKIATTTDRAERIRLANECDKLIWENVMNFPIYERQELTAVPKGLANFGAMGLASFHGEDIGYLAD